MPDVYGQRLKFIGVPEEMRDPVKIGTLGDFAGVKPPYIWVLFDGTHAAQTVMPADVANSYRE